MGFFVEINLHFFAKILRRDTNSFFKDKNVFVEEITLLVSISSSVCRSKLSQAVHIPEGARSFEERKKYSFFGPTFDSVVFVKRRVKLVKHRQTLINGTI